MNQNKNEKYSDEQIKEFTHAAEVLSDMAIDSFLKKRKTVPGEE
ncbi:MAG TPA: hypothetical protein VM077_00270 [Candidatus Limnocylindrales bacterium]|nr:hypothetical protein [Candidatus Limnocylindrales bacterium]